MPGDVSRRPSIVLWLIRAGETDWDDSDRLRGDEDLPLSKGGRAASIEAFERATTMPFAPPARIHHPLDSGATETARLASSALGGRPRGNDELADPALGVLAGLSMIELRDRFERRARQWEDDPSNLVPPEGEPFADARTRLVDALRAILKRKPPTVGLVLHELAGGFVRAALAGTTDGNPRRWMEGRPRVELWVLPLDAAARLARPVRETSDRAGG